MMAINAKTFLGVCLAFIIHGCCCQKITFPTPIQYKGSCGVTDGQGNWSTTGTVKLSEVDRILFAPKLEIHTCAPTCSLDLTKCLSKGSIPETADACFCQKQSGDLLTVHIGAEADPTQSGLSVQAMIPSYDNFGQLTTASVIGIIPTIPEKRPPVKPTYQVDGSLVQPLLSVQTIQVCPNEFVTINICVEDKAPGSVIQVHINRINMTTDDKCLKFPFESTSAHKISFSYKESVSCTRSQISILFIQASQGGCPSTTQQTITPNNSKMITESTTLNTPAPTSRFQDCSSPDIMKFLSPGMTQLCDNNIDGGKWKIIQRRTSDKVDFFRKWTDYENGFGEQPDNFWLGLKAIHHLCNLGCELRFDLKYNGTSYYAQYDHFKVEGADTNYRMFVSGYHGNAGDDGKYNGFMYHSGMSFSTADRDHDKLVSINCVNTYRGPWWTKSCHAVNLNGEWGNAAKGLNWGALTGFNDSVTLSEMKVRQQN